MSSKSSGVLAASATTGRPRLHIVRDPEPNLRPFQHQPWCTEHCDGGNDPTGQFCNSESLAFDFGDRGPMDYRPGDATLELEHFWQLDADEPASTDPTLIHLDAGRDINLEVDQAEALGYGLLAMVALERGDRAAYEALAGKARAAAVTRPATMHRLGA